MLTPAGEEFYRDHLKYDSAEYASLDRALLCRYTDAELELIRDYEALMAAHFTRQSEKD